MLLYSTKDRSHQVGIKEAVFQGLPPDNGLYMPNKIPKLPPSFFENLSQLSFQEIGFSVCKNLFQGSIPDKDIQNIIEKSVTFPAPVVKLDEQKSVLELFHGPSLAFKDFGAQFMAQLMGYFNQNEDKELTILVATSGDTGGAVAAGFHKTPGIKVIILYPSGKVSPLQEKQLTTLGHNITALEVNGTFDDCQNLVKQAFLDKELRSQLRLSSANSINISRLIPQSFYYFEAYKQAKKDQPLVFCIPSGNFGNLTAGLLAYKMGLDIHQFIAATNVNDIVPAYLNEGVYKPKASVRTISNAMDVGNPSNFARMLDLFSILQGKGIDTDKDIWAAMKGLVQGYAFTDKETEEAILKIEKEYDYLIDPHGAVAYLALKDYQNTHPNTTGIILETAHPSKFKEEMERIVSHDIDIPSRLAQLNHLEKEAISIDIEFDSFKNWLLDNL